MAIALAGGAAEARAQGRAPCEFPRAAVGVGGTALALNTAISRDVTGAIVNATLDEEFKLGGGLGLRANADVGLARTWSARVEVGDSLVHVTRRASALNRGQATLLSSTSAGFLNARDVTVALVGERSPFRAARVCGTYLVGAGRYALQYRDSRAASPGVFAGLGFDLLVSRRNAIEVYLRLDDIWDRSRPPVQAYGVLVLSATLSIKHWF